mmetsp:Transcript_63821/g.207382  ORF Transcript_63821/g.207382 Transcript_63821/m.207382 type:complete len:125 (-) Transcript_63821:87-461(-)
MGDCAEGEMRVMHILRKHKECRKPSSAREKVITCTVAEATRHLQVLRESLVQGGLDFDRLMGVFGEAAKKHSDCGSAKKSGDLGCFTRGRMQKPFEDAAFALAVGEMSTAIETESGIHLIFRVQ